MYINARVRQSRYLYTWKLRMRDQGPEATGERGKCGHFSDALGDFAASLTTERVDLATIVQYMGQRSIGALLLVLALPMALPIPTAGISVVFGVPLILISTQLLLGRRCAWLPARLTRRSVTRTDLTAFVERALPTLRALERIVRPRIGWLAGDWAMMPVGAICLILAVIITLPIPLGHMVPGAAISVPALGLIERDGLAIGFGVAIAVLGLILAAFASTGLVMALRSHLLSGLSGR
jgi:hypothetical protein